MNFRSKVGLEEAYSKEAFNDPFEVFLIMKIHRDWKEFAITDCTAKILTKCVCKGLYYPNGQG